MRSILDEIIRKECEAYQLIDLGLLSSEEEGVERMSALSTDIQSDELADVRRFLSWRKDILERFYHSIGFDTLVRNGKDVKSFRHFLFALKKKGLRIYRHRYQGKTIDKELAVPPCTVAFKLSALLADEQYREEAPVLDTMRMPSEIEKYYQQRCAACFPLDLNGFLNRLKREDSAFWDEVFRLIRQMSGKMMSYLSVSLQYKEEVLQDTWSETCLLVREKIKSNVLPKMESSLHLRHYIGRICRNKAYEATRVNQPDEVPGWSDDFWNQIEESLKQEQIPGIEYEDIDPDNDGEVNRTLAVILLDKVSPWYERLTTGMEEKAELLLAHYEGGKSYEEIAGKEVDGLSTKERVRLENNLRQTVSRTRRLLRQRFVELLQKEQKRYNR